MPTINMLRANGIRAIIDYAAEDDSPSPAAANQPQHTAQQQAPSSSAAAIEGSGSGPASPSAAAAGAAGSWEPAPNLVAVGRQYSYENEATCDKHVEVFLKAIDTVAKLPDQGFAAIKVTALGNPQLLERMSAALVEIRDLFREADTDGECPGGGRGGQVPYTKQLHGDVVVTAGMRLYAIERGILPRCSMHLPCQ